jgi:hypothetical protein
VEVAVTKGTSFFGSPAVAVAGTASAAAANMVATARDAMRVGVVMVGLLPRPLWSGLFVVM